jgi:hypothetical protein
MAPAKLGALESAMMMPTAGRFAVTFPPADCPAWMTYVAA